MPMIMLAILPNMDPVDTTHVWIPQTQSEGRSALSVTIGLPSVRNANRDPRALAIYNMQTTKRDGR